jgi:arginyl-tRNA synthetase
MKNVLISIIKNIVFKCFGCQIEESSIDLRDTKKDVKGDFTLLCYPLVKIIGSDISNITKNITEGLSILSNIKSVEYINGFLNITVTDYFIDTDFKWEFSPLNDGSGSKTKEPQNIVLEFSSPNTNKPLHLGHIRNTLIGDSLSKILKAYGHNVKTINLINDRGIHICKSIYAYMKFGEGDTPEKSNLKGDHFVGKYYVMFNDIESPEVLLEVQDLLKRWENNDPEVLEIWKTMNDWVYAGFNKTYDSLSICFDETVYESDIYQYGKSIVNKGLENGIFCKKEDGSIFVDLTEDGLDEKLLLRNDGTSIYITQDLGTAIKRYEDNQQPDKMIYVVGNEQDYHFDALKKTLSKIDNEVSDSIYHLSYGMVELPDGILKSRKGVRVDADDLIAEMISMSREISIKSDDITEDTKEIYYNRIGMSALKFFILKVDPKTKMMFDPKESIEFKGMTGPFIQYTYTRISSILRKCYSETELYNYDRFNLDIYEREKSLLMKILKKDEVLKEAAEKYSPAIICKYVYELSQEFNSFYVKYQVVKEEDINKRNFRIKLLLLCKKTLQDYMNMLGIEMVEYM